MAFTLAHLAAIEAAIGSGTLTVTYDGNTKTHRSMADLKQAHEIVRNDLISQGLIRPPALSNRGPGAVTTFYRD